MMRLNQGLIAAGLLLAAWLAPVEVARADMIVYNSMNVYQGQQSFTDTFTLTAPGTLTVGMSGQPWFGDQSLSFFLSSPKGALGSPLQSNGTESMSIGAGTYYANWVGNAENSYDLGVVGVNIAFQPYGATVALPASIILMLSGLGLLFAWPRLAAAVPTSRSGVSTR